MPDSTLPSHRLPHRLALAAVLLLAAFLHFYQLAAEGFSNLYYSATVKSMMSSWANFFYASYDPGGFVSVDKPPVGFWVQAVSAWIFGYSGWSLLLPQAVAGVLSVLVMYFLVKRLFGPTAGVLAALVLTLTPIFIAANRNNTMDSQLVLVCLLAAWTASLAAERGQLRWLLLSALLIGLGFNIKMLQAYLVLPALFLVYFVAAPIRWWKRIVHLGLATLLLLAVSLSWALAVDLTPEDQRPYVGSSQDNTVMELVIGHNGMARLLPGGIRRALGIASGPAAPAVPGGGLPSNRPGNLPPGTPPRPPVGALPGQPVNPPGGALPSGQIPQQPGVSGGTPFAQETGEPGLLRLFNRQLGGQASWLLPLAFVGLFAAAWQSRLQWPLSARHAALFLWAMWLVPQLVFFSIANLFHRYYLEMLAPGVAALAAIGLVALWDDYRRAGWKGWLLPVALPLCAAFQAVLLIPFPNQSRYLSPIVIGLSLAAAAALALARITHHSSRITAYVSRFTFYVSLIALLLPSAIWSFSPLYYGGNAALPFAGPDLAAPGGVGAPPNAQAAPAGRAPVNAGDAGIPSNNRLIEFLLQNRSGEKFMLAVPRSSDASPIIITTGEAVMALGGFSGGDNILTADELAQKVADGEVRYFLFSGDAGQQAELAQWVQQSCAVVPASEWGGPVAGQAQQPGNTPGGQNQQMAQLYDCRP